jgi:hypothetical protein
MLIKRLDECSVTINWLKNGSKETNDLVQTLKVGRKMVAQSLGKLDVPFII